MSNAFLISAIASGGGKTTVTLALLAALKERGLEIAPFKCGPDYIDTAFHSRISNKNALNLDPWMMGEDSAKDLFNRRVEGSDCAVVEGVMGLFDGVRPNSHEGSSYHVSKLLELPVVLVLDCAGMAGSVAPVVKGCSEFRKDVKIAGVIANRVGSSRHAGLIKTTLESEGLPPLLGYFAKDKEISLPERHLGLVQAEEMENWKIFVNKIAEKAEEEIDIDRLLDLTKRETSYVSSLNKKRSNTKKLKIALAQDEAFSFYYPENIRVLEEEGAEVVIFSPIHEKFLPQNCDMIYLGGGYPELYADKLSENLSLQQEIKSFAESGGVIYAECGGFIYLGNSLAFNSKTYNMCGVLPFNFENSKKLQRLGYREIKTTKESLLGPRGTRVRGHEFHYSFIKKSSEFNNIYDITYPVKATDSFGCQYKNVLAGYIHLYWGSSEKIASNIISFCKKSKIA